MSNDIFEGFAGNFAVLRVRAVHDECGRSRRVAVVALAFLVGDNDRFDGRDVLFWEVLFVVVMRMREG